ncbi:unnamed protein product, partial [Phaeothamnion confervicola]
GGSGGNNSGRRQGRPNRWFTGGRGGGGSGDSGDGGNSRGGQQDRGQRDGGIIINDSAARSSPLSTFLKSVQGRTTAAAKAHVAMNVMRWGISSGHNCLPERSAALEEQQDHQHARIKRLNSLCICIECW